MKNKCDSMQNSNGKSSKTQSNVTVLRKLFENNFKLSNLTNAFKSKNHHSVGKNIATSKNVPDLDITLWCRLDESKENRKAEGVSSISDVVSVKNEGCYVSCKIENCCCKTFFRQYDGTPNFRHASLAKSPLQQRNNNSNFDRRLPERWSAASCSNNSLGKEYQQHRFLKCQEHRYRSIPATLEPKSEGRRNRLYISYDFYKSKTHEIFDETPVSAVSTKWLKPSAVHKAGRRMNLLEKITSSETDDSDGIDSDHSNGSKRKSCVVVPFHKSEASGFVNFTTASLSEGGYIKNALDLKPALEKSRGDHELSECDNEQIRVASHYRELGLGVKLNDVKNLELRQSVNFEGKACQTLVEKANLESKAHMTYPQNLIKEPPPESKALRFPEILIKKAPRKLFEKRNLEDKAYQELLHRLKLGGRSFGRAVRETESYHTRGFGFKHHMPRLKNIALRENTHPYSIKKSRLTVKSVKNRNIRRRQKQAEHLVLARSQTFSGYDNFAYRRSISELQIAREPEASVTNADESVTMAKTDATDEDKYDCNLYNNVHRLHPDRISAVCMDEAPQFHLDSRMTSYNWPVTSFYVGRDDKESCCGSRRSFSSIDLRSKQPDQEKTVNPVTRKTNLRRHFSLGHLKDEFFEYNFTQQPRSLESISKVSATCGIRNIHEVNNKIIKARKFQNLDIHVHALFAAVEHGYVEKTKTILESSDVDVNSVNSDGLSPLDVAVLSNNKPLVKLLVAYGAQEGRKFYSADDMRNHLYHLLHEAERRVQELSSSLRLNIESDQSSLSSSSSNIPSITIGDSAQNKTYSIWERRAKGLKRMLMGFEQIRPPDLPSVVTIEVTSTSSVMVYFTENDNKDSPVTTKFRVQWSTDKDFSSLCGHYEVADTRQLRYHINNLRKGQAYYVRVASGNVRGYSSYKLSTPSLIVPSSWQDITEKDIRFSNSMRNTLDSIFTNVVVTHPYLKSNVELYGQGGELLVSQRRKKTSIKQLFTAASKFQKHLRRGVYLACLLYHEDKVLVTNEDFLPVIEVDENYPKKIHNDFHWFFKVAFSWNDLKWLKSDMEKSQNSSAVFRIKLLQAAVHMQTALSIQELGKLYHKMLRDVEGTIVISVINYIHSPKSVSVLNLRWMPLAKLTKRANLVNFAESNVADILIASIPEQITYHQVSKIKLPRGLYLSYLKMRSSVDSLQVLVPSRTPNMPPHCKVRDNPHVTAEEWEWLVKKENLRESLATATYQQRLFIEQIVVTARRLFTLMEVPDEEAVNHRLYDTEVIEVNKDVSLIMVVPPAETSCSMPGQRELLLQRSDLLPLTVQVFEMVHFGTYQLDLISMYSRLSCIIEMDVDLAQHSLRKAFNSIEVSTAKSKLNELESLHAQLNTAWKKSRWLLDVISFARDRLSTSPITMRQLLNVHPKRTLPSAESHCYLQPPDPKTAKSRGSWPGVGVGRHLGRMPNEISRSEQHLTSESLSVTSTQTVTKCSSAKTSSPIERASENEEMMAVTRSSSADMTDQMDGSRSTTYKPSAQPTSGNSSSGSTHSISSDEMSISKVGGSDDGKEESEICVPVPTPAVMKIYAAYNTGLETRVYFKFQVSPRTTAREIVDMFVKQTNMSVVLKGKDSPVYADDELLNFCLVAVIGARERCLRDDFRPVQLQQPWKDGRLYVRRKSNVLAAIECDAKQSPYV